MTDMSSRQTKMLMRGQVERVGKEQWCV